jgi:acyl-CoA synthetase (AMP-forming)/AMP-acid ligase II/acyl carrier protein
VNPSNIETLIDLLAHRAQISGDKTAFVFLFNGEKEVEAVSFAELYQETQRAAALLRSRCAPGDRAVLLFPSGIEFVVAFFACLLAGVVAVPLNVPRTARSDPRTEAVVRDCGASIVLCGRDVDAQGLERGIFSDGRTTPCVKLCELAGAQGHWVPPAISGDAIAYLQYTSGSTGDPKGVMVSHRNVLTNLRLLRNAFRTSEADVKVSWLPLFHDMGLVGSVFHPISAGAKCVLMAPAAFLQRPFRWVKAISDHAASLSGGPNFAFDLCVERTTEEQRAQLDLSLWARTYNGAETVRAETLARFAKAFAVAGFRPSSFVPCYGLAEATLMVGSRKDGHPMVCQASLSALNEGRLQDEPALEGDVTSLVGCGSEGEGEEIVVVSPETHQALGENEVGEIWVRGASVAVGYWGRPEATRETFGGRIVARDGEFLRTGDLGVLHRGELYIAGRIKDLIIVRGANHYPQDIEHTVQQACQDVEPAGVAAFALGGGDAEEQLTIVAELRRGSARSTERAAVFRCIREAVSSRHDVAVDRILLVGARRLPKTSSGKIQRARCRERVREEAFELLGAWQRADVTRQSDGGASEPSSPIMRGIVGETRCSTVDEVGLGSDRPRRAPGPSKGEIRQWLVSWVATRMGIAAESIDTSATFSAHGLDSLRSTELAQAIHEWLGAEQGIDATLVWEYPTIDVLAEALFEHGRDGSMGDARGGQSHPTAGHPGTSPGGAGDAGVAQRVADEIRRARELL